MKKAILILLLLTISTTLAEDDLVYLLDIHYDRGAITLNEISLETGYSPDYKIQYGDYKLHVFSYENEDIYNFNFGAPRIYSDKSDLLTGELSGDAIDLEEADFALLVPYFKDGNTIKISKNGIEMFSTDISEFTAQKGPKINYWPYAIAALLFIILLIILFRRRRNQ